MKAHLNLSMRLLTFIIPFFLIVSLTSCREREGYHKTWSSLGDYRLNATELTLKISKDSEGLIKLCVTNQEDLVSELNTRASIYQRWFVFWDEQKMSLWFYSGDIGCSVFSIDETKGIARDPGSIHDKIADIPEPFRMELPKNMSDALERSRK